MRSEIYTVLDDERGTLEIEFFRGMAFLHSVFRKPIAAMRKAREVFPEIKAMLRRIGYRLVHVIIPDGDSLLFKFERLFGFNEVGRHGGSILMAQEV